MILDVHGERALAGLERHALRHRPRGERAVALEPEVVVQPPGVVALDDEDRLLARALAGAETAPASSPGRACGGTRSSSPTDSRSTADWHVLHPSFTVRDVPAAETSKLSPTGGYAPEIRFGGPRRRSAFCPLKTLWMMWKARPDYVPNSGEDAHRRGTSPAGGAAQLLARRVLELLERLDQRRPEQRGRLVVIGLRAAARLGDDRRRSRRARGSAARRA